ncbi:restriction endonuclease subunit S [Metapseudomonas otitidis]|uniref:restriction endonuclease subunit S n=1 Tax=Metapseudomonas otitidis TaxID=319939 RepID=UPI0020968449|nr:restriction endonuclease subunit S [Pseudomonas otitidis]MCO7554717.1 restriction endonuclease subunit S [Pseudomonas otitidis]
MSVFLEAPLETLCRKVTDGTHDSPKLLPDGVPFIKGKHISQGYLNLDYCDYISREDHLKVIARSKPERGDTLFSNIGSVGDSAFVNTDAEFSIKNVALFKPDFERVVPKYLFYLLRSPSVLGGLLSIRSGSAQPFIGLETLRKYMVRYHGSLSTQSQVVSILSAYDDLIENNTRRIEILEEIARRLYEEWFVQFRFPGREGVEFKESEFGLIPEGWSVVKLEEICDLITDGAHKSPPTAETGMPMASVKDMHDWGIDVSKCRKISQPDYDALVRNNCKPMVGDVLVAKDGSYLKHIFSVEKDQDLVLLSSIAILRPTNKSVSDLLVCLLRHPETIARMKGCVSGVAIPRIILKDFRKFQVVLPNQGLQEAWLAIASPLMRLCRKLVDKNANLRAQRDLLLPKLISGEIDVSDIPMPT